MTSPALQTWQPELGAVVVPGEGVRFTVWAPRASTVEVVLAGPPASGNGNQAQGTRAAHNPLPVSFFLLPHGDGMFAGTVPGIGAGTRYRYRLNGGESFPDPCSRSQPDGPHGPSEVVDPAAFRWRWSAAWPGLDPRRLVIYEVHVGTATPQGTFDALIPQLSYLRRLGVTAIELMPVASFPGRRNWGYDGVDLFAPAAVYGGPDGLRRLVDAAHRHGLGVLLDVVYNHLGPDGNYLNAYASDYFTDRHHTPWGDALNFDGPNAARVRQFIIENACHWLCEYRLDGLRLDAVHAIFDESPRHILQELTERAKAAAGRPVLIIAESHDNDVRLIDPPARGGYGLDGVWSDDFHHALRTYLTGEHDGYYVDYRGTLEDVARALKGGFLYQGEPSVFWGRQRGTRVTDQPAERFVICIQNHDQVGNRAFGERLNHQLDAARYAVASAVLLLAPETPLLFMGQEFAASSPFLYFTDHHPELGKLVTEGRRAEFRTFAAFSDPVRRAAIPDPQAAATFLRSKLDLNERATHAPVVRLYRGLLRLRQTDGVLREPDRVRLAAGTVADDVLVLYRWGPAGHRLIAANFGAAARLDMPTALDGVPLPAGRWRLLFSSLRRSYGGTGVRPALQVSDRALVLRMPARAAAVFALA